MYGPGEDALKLTVEYATEESLHTNLTEEVLFKNKNRLCTLDFLAKECTDEYSFVPLALIFLSQFVLGIGKTLKNLVSLL